MRILPTEHNDGICRHGGTNAHIDSAQSPVHVPLLKDTLAIPRKSEVDAACSNAPNPSMHKVLWTVILDATKNNTIAPETILFALAKSRRVTPKSKSIDGKSALATVGLFSRHVDVFVHSDKINGLLSVKFSEPAESLASVSRIPYSVHDKFCMTEYIRMFVAGMHAVNREKYLSQAKEDAEDIVLLEHFHPDLG